MKIVTAIPETLDIDTKEDFYKKLINL